MNRRTFLKSLPFVAAAIPALRGLEIESAEAVTENEPVAEAGPVFGLTVDEHGALCVGGDFMDSSLYESGYIGAGASGITSRNIAKWNGDAWEKLF